MKPALTLLLALSTAVLLPAGARAQLPACTGSDAEGASRAFEAGNRLMSQAIEQAGRRRIDRARELAAEALEHFDRQCELGDDSALAERGAALMLMGEFLRSSQSFDAYLRAHPLDSLDARTRRRLEANLQPGEVTVIVENEADVSLFVDDLDFGALPRETPLRLPLGEHRLEARAATGDVLAEALANLSESETSTSITLTLPAPEPEPEPEPIAVTAPPPHEDRPEPTAGRTDFTGAYIATGAATGAFLILAIGLQLGADERARTFNDVCVATGGMATGCDAVHSEWEGLFGAYITSWVLTGVAAIAFGTVLGLDLGQPRGPVRIGFGPMRDGGALSISGSF